MPQTQPPQSQQQEKERQAQQKEGKGEEKEEEAAAHPNFSGVWKSLPGKNENYDQFLNVQGVPYMKRKIANNTVVTHTIEMEGDTVNLEVRVGGWVGGWVD